MANVSDPVAVARALAASFDLAERTRYREKLLLAHMDALDIPIEHADGWRAAIDNLCAALTAQRTTGWRRHYRQLDAILSLWERLAERWKADRVKLAKWRGVA